MEGRRVGFSTLTREKMRCYVYRLVDPRTDEAFYVGKGTGDRVFSHMAGDGGDEASQKLRTIAEIREAGFVPVVQIVAHDLDDDKALLLEAVLIRTTGLGTLANRVHGRYTRDLLLTIDDVESRYGARTVDERTLTERVLLVSLNGGRRNTPFPNFQHLHAEVERRTLGDWKVAAKSAARVELVAGVYGGVVRSLFDVRGPSGAAQVHATGRERRLRFSGRVLTDHPLYLARLIGADGRERTTFGPQQAFAYVGPVR